MGEMTFLSLSSTSKWLSSTAPWIGRGQRPPTRLSVNSLFDDLVML